MTPIEATPSMIPTLPWGIGEWIGPQQGRSALIAEVAVNPWFRKAILLSLHRHCAEFQWAGSLDFDPVQPYLVDRTGDREKCKSSGRSGDCSHLSNRNSTSGRFPGVGVRKAEDHGSLISENPGTSRKSLGCLF